MAGDILMPKLGLTMTEGLLAQFSGLEILGVFGHEIGHIRHRHLLYFTAFIGVSLVAVVLMLPLKSFEPYVVTVDRTTGYIEVKSGLTRPANLTEQQAITQANVVRYTRAREGYDPSMPAERNRPDRGISASRSIAPLLHPAHGQKQSGRP